jgi:TPR repeat protein
MFRAKGAVFLVTFTVGIPALAQDQFGQILTMGLGDMAEIKRRAEAGDAAAQVTLANSLAAHSQSPEAFQWYRRAAIHGNADGEYHVGQMLLFGGAGFQGRAAQTDQVEGLHWTFMAATNRQPYGLWNMSKALQQGLGTSTNLIAAYAWLKLFSETSPGGIVGRVEMNTLALKMSTVDLQAAENLAAQFKLGNWQSPIVRVIPEGDSRLKLGGIFYGTKMPVAVINGKTFAEGESGDISVKPGKIKIKCLNVRQDSVVIAVDGEDGNRVLSLTR